MKIPLGGEKYLSLSLSLSLSLFFFFWVQNTIAENST